MARLSFLRFLPLLLPFLNAASHAISLPPSDSDASTLSSRDTRPACGQIVHGTTRVFVASLVLECLESVPFNAAVATKFIKYYHDTIQFQSTLAYLKNPPASYQQPAVDFVGGLNQIQLAINTGAYKNQYEFEVALQTLIYSAHDSHIQLFAGILSVFSFGTNLTLASVSENGIDLPKIYLSDHLLASQDAGGAWNASAISQINGVDAVTYLTEFAAKNGIGGLEAHADFNQLMESPAGEIQSLFGIWGGGATFYPGDTLTIKLENTTQIGPVPWLAIYNSLGDTGPLETGGDFYNFYVLGLYPASYDPFSFDFSADNPTSTVDTSSPTDTPSTTSTDTSSSTPTETDAAGDVAQSWLHPAYPDVASIAQPDLGQFGGGFVSGYFLHQSSVAVLSIPSFSELEGALNTFSQTVALFLNASKEAGMKRVVIDLQQNYGGDSLLAFDTFRHFFPNTTSKPFGGSRLRAHEALNVMGDVITSYFDTLTPDDDDYYSLLADEFVSSDLINANTNRNFTSWAEFYGPHLYNGDNFTTVQQFNLSSELYTTVAVQDDDENFTVYGYDANKANTTQPYDAKDIIILSDALCASTCSIFMEMMHHEAGVRTVVAGGHPSYGPMQAPGLTRGAVSFSVIDILDGNIEFAQELLQELDDQDQNFLPNRTEALDVLVSYAGINLRDQVRRDQEIPVQFIYEPADCRIFFTPQTWYNYTALWQYAADAVWTNSKLCVTNSTGWASTNGTTITAPSSTITGNTVTTTAQEPQEKLGAIIMSMVDTSTLETAPIKADVKAFDALFYEGWQCPKDLCPEGYFCYENFTNCTSTGETITARGCVLLCDLNFDTSCSNSGTCRALNSKVAGAQFQDQFGADYLLFDGSGFCEPPKKSCTAPKPKTTAVKKKPKACKLTPHDNTCG